MLQQHESTCEGDGTFFSRMMSLNAHYLDTIMVLILEASKDVLSHKDVLGIKLDYNPMCENNHNEMLVQFRFSLVTSDNTSPKLHHQTEQLPIPCVNLGYDEAFDISSLRQAIPHLSLASLKQLSPLLQNLVTSCEGVDPTVWNDFFMEYDLQGKLFETSADIAKFYEDSSHLLKLKNHIENFVISQNMPQKPSLPAKKM